MQASERAALATFAELERAKKAEITSAETRRDEKKANTPLAQILETLGKLLATLANNLPNFGEPASMVLVSAKTNTTKRVAASLAIRIRNGFGMADA